MKPKYKAFVFNFMGFALIFLLFRLTMGYLFTFNQMLMAMVSAIGASVLAPKFIAVQSAEAQKVFMKWIFIKGLREV